MHTQIIHITYMCILFRARLSRKGTACRSAWRRGAGESVQMSNNTTNDNNGNDDTTTTYYYYYYYY